MRPIKFRAWDKHNKIMWPIKTLHFNQETGVLEALGFSYRGAIFEPDEDKNVLMQFTGLHDKNGKEIWEGDVVRSYFDYSDEDGQPCGEKHETHEVVKFEKGIQGWPSFRAGVLNFGEFEIEVVGNIYENPELLKSQPKQS